MADSGSDAETAQLISFPAPALCQGADEDVLIEICASLFPGCVMRQAGENGLRVWVVGVPTDLAAREQARARFQTGLGVLRAWRTGAGELKDERLSGLGEGSIRDGAGNNWVMVGTAIGYGIVGDEVADFAELARRGLQASDMFKNALWLNGRSGRTAADFYMIYEYLSEEFGGSKRIAAALGLSVSSQKRLTQSANNLSPLEGGRHVQQDIPAVMSLEEQQKYVADLLRRWIMTYR